MTPATRTRKRNCDLPEFCDAHVGRRRRGPHLRAEVVIPTPGATEAAVYRMVREDGARAAWIEFWDGCTWSAPQPLPEQPKRAHAAAVRRARRFLKTGALS